jgi:broad specificity phosphatase PhoE
MSSAFSTAGVFAASIPLLLVLALWTAALFSQSVANFVYKLHLIRLGFAHLLFSSDKKWKKLGDPERVNKKRSKTIYFVRHGESQWNVVFNKGFGKTFPKRLGSALQKEGHLFTTLDSVFFDSPLSVLGAEQAVELQNYIEGIPDSDPASVLKGADTSKSVLVSSNLRRALSTETIGFWQRLKRTQEKIHVLSSLQEITFNFDGVALSKPYSYPVLADEEIAALSGSRADFDPDRYFDCTDNLGDKPIRGKGVKRMLEFCKWCFKREEPNIIAAGHSLYFRFFFQTFLPYASVHEAKKSKMANGSVVSFTIWEGKDPNQEDRYVIDESSIKVLHHNFESSHAKHE